jgi:Reverse transcriptase (RNA-dependent DNA polymerase)
MNKMKGKNLYLLIYVDAIFVIGPDEKEIAQAKKILSELYEVKDIGVAKYFLGVEIHQDDDGSMRLSQTSYVNKLCDRYKMGVGDAKPVISPTELGQLSKLRSKEPSTAAESIDMTMMPYRELIGKSLFLSTRTRPDIAVAVGIFGETRI